MLWRIVDEHGEELRLSPWLDHPPFPIRFSGEVRPYLGPTFALTMAGIPADVMRDTHDARLLEVALAEREPASPSEVLGLRILDSVVFPGYEPAALEFPLSSVEFGLSAVDVTMVSNGREFGVLRVVLEHIPPSLVPRSVAAHDLRGTGLTLRSDLDESLTFRMPDPTSTEAVYDLEGIPYGTYLASLALAGGLSLYPESGDPPCVASIGPAPATLRFDLSGRASLRLEIRPSDRSGGRVSGTTSRPGRYGGRVAGFLIAGSEGEGRSHHFSFDGPPYQLFGLTPGPYRLVLQMPAIEPDPHAEPCHGGCIRFEARAGEATVLELALAP